METGHLILLVDGDDGFASDFRSACSDEDIELRVSKEGKSAIHVAWSDLPSAIVLRTELPDISGYAICNALKTNPRLREIPLALISETATQQVFDQHEKLRTRADFYFTTPLSANGVLAAIRSRLDDPRERILAKLRAIEAKEPKLGVPVLALALGILLLVAILIYVVWGR